VGGALDAAAPARGYTWRLPGRRVVLLTAGRTGFARIRDVAAAAVAEHGRGAPSPSRALYRWPIPSLSCPPPRQQGTNPSSPGGAEPPLPSGGSVQEGDLLDLRGRHGRHDELRHPVAPTQGEGLLGEVHQDDLELAPVVRVD